ncbi:DAK2 domain-containing protein [Glaciihabitans sp. UYNi722]|uniref:DAK2 domain-containing protein n=1 Tax=Glaciihabitans sp. UYNi722 TaxID=3156344 RepID=UPI003391B718
MDSNTFREIIGLVSQRQPAHEEELRDLDAALGDGDLGITVSAGSRAVCAALEPLTDEATFTAILIACGKAFSVANPSTFAALIGGGLLAAAKSAEGKTELGRADILELADALAGRIVARGKAQLGDKTILDALLPSLDTFRNSLDSPEVLNEMILIAQCQIDETASLQSARGRASWGQERSIGHKDPGATAYLRFLEDLLIVISPGTQRPDLSDVGT